MHQLGHFSQSVESRANGTARKMPVMLVLCLMGNYEINWKPNGKEFQPGRVCTIFLVRTKNQKYPTFLHVRTAKKTTETYLAKVFTTSEAVNKALRTILAALPNSQLSGKV